MLIEQIIEKLTGMRLHGMANGLRQWAESRRDVELRPEDLVGILADAEWVHRENNKLTARLRKARFRQQACVEDIIYTSGRGVTKAVINELSASRWVASHRNIILTGPTGVGKSYLACALGQKACRDGYGVLYKRTSRLFDELAQARADGTYALALRRIAKTPVLILDDFGLQPMAANERRDLLEVLEDRYNTASTVVTSQLEPNLWHAVIGDETIADSICDRLVHGARRISLAGESIRKVLADEATHKPLTREHTAD
ncbi:MAG: IS21-like element helper ATPase IstB [Myxococcota bacterium]